MNIRTKIKELVTFTPIISNMYFKYCYTRHNLSNKALKGKLQYLGHCIDLMIHQEVEFSNAKLREMSYLLRESLKRKLVIDDALLWCFKMFLMGKYTLTEGQYDEKENLKFIHCDNTLNNDKIVDIIMQRRSVRRWTGEKIDTDVIHKILDIAKWAPSSCNRQLWQTLIVTKQADISLISEYFPNKFYTKAPMLIIVLMNVDLYGSNEKHFAYLDGAAFIQNLLLLLHSSGFGACWIGFKGWDCWGNIHLDESKCKLFYSHFKLNRSLLPISMIALGYAASFPKAPPRQNLKDIVISR